MRLVVLLGVLSLFGDMTYEGARSITGPFLATLGASGLVVGVVAGFGELAGYSVRLLSGRGATSARRTWAITISGYALNLFAVPALALAGNWPVAAALIILERIGKGTRVPPRDAMLSHATKEMGRGWGFGLHEAMDQTGAMVGPLIVAVVLARGHSYNTAFALLLIPATLAIFVLLSARMQYPDPRALEEDEPDPGADHYPRSFWLYLVAAGLIGAGFADFPLIAFHFEKAGVVRAESVPLLYALAMGVAGGSSLLLGRLYDRRGLVVVAGASLIGAAFAPLVFYGSATWAIVGMICWGVGMGSQESIMRAVVAGMVSAEHRARAYGVFNTGFGLCWFGGSTLLGFLYDRSHVALVVVSVCLQVAALPVLVAVARRLSTAGRGEGVSGAAR
jgi:MFS family permease